MHLCISRGRHALNEPAWRLYLQLCSNCRRRQWRRQRQRRQQIGAFNNHLQCVLKPLISCRRCERFQNCSNSDSKRESERERSVDRAERERQLDERMRAVRAVAPTALPYRALGVTWLVLPSLLLSQLLCLLLLLWLLLLLSSTSRNLH